MGKKTILIAAGAAGLTAAIAGALYFFVLGGSGGGAAAAAVDPTPVHVEGRLCPHILIEDRVYNLASTGGGRHFLKLNAVIEFETSDPAWFKLSGEALEAGLVEFDHEIGTGRALIEDAVATLVSARTAEELSTAKGKDALREDIRNAVAHLIEEPRVNRVLFTTFITD